MQRIEEDLPAGLRPHVQRMRRGLSRLEKQLASARVDARRSWASLLREASHQLGRIEALGEREWRKRTIRARRDTAALLRRLEKAVEPRRPSAAGRKPARRGAAPSPAPPAARVATTARASSLPAGAPASALVSQPTPGGV